MVKPGEDACAVGPAEGRDIEAAAGSECIESEPESIGVFLGDPISCSESGESE